jgi:NDP-sugar pyrophosphorylase family protein
MHTPIVILAGGMATRLFPETKSIPKSMLMIAGKPFIDHQLCLLAKNNVEHVILCLGHLGESIWEFVGTGHQYGINVTYVLDGDALLGTGGAIYNALSIAGDMFFVMYGDSYLTEPFEPIEKYFKNSTALALMTIFENHGQYDVSNILFENNSIIQYNKSLIGGTHIDYGLSLFRSTLFDNIKFDIPFDMSAILKHALQQKRLASWLVKDRFYEIGSFAGREDTAKYLTERQ